MDKCPADIIWYLLVVIVNHESGSKVLKYARLSGITGGTILLGHGTIGNRYAKWFEDYEIRKEIVLMVSPKPLVDKTIDRLNKMMKLDKPNHGIAFALSVADLLGSSLCKMSGNTQREDGKHIMEQAIIVIIEKGQAEAVVSAAEQAGARGATVINGRGAGIHETSKLFSMEIEPEKEIVLILAKSDSIAAITRNICQKMQLDKPGKGILFVIDVQKAYGMIAQ